MIQHTSYRQRAIDHFHKEGVDSVDDIHALELLPFFAIPHESTTLLAHELLDEFGNLEHVMESTEEELEKVPGMNKQAATLIVLTNAISR